MRFCALVAAFLAPSAVWSQDDDLLGGPKVDTEWGQIEGKKDKSLTKKNVDKFLGIPYAAPPVGDFRFRPPQPFNDSWAPKTRKTTSLGHVCPQLDIASFIELGKEDCLYLNVYRPSGTKPGANLPVFVWIYGGGYFIGDGHEFGLYDGTTLVQKHEYIIVTLNYRLSGHGFMALPELQDEDPDGTVGNYGVQDQRAALQWVQRNIKNFGGDPDKVTLAGESAGAFSVTYHTVAPASRGLFSAAIMESGTSHNSWFFQNKSQAFEFYSEWATILGCPTTLADRLKCLRNLNTRDLVISFAQMAKDIIARITGVPLPDDIPDFASPLWPLMPFGPVIDGTDVGLPDVPYTLMQKGEFAKVPLIIGANKDGGGYFGLVLPLLWGGLKSDFKKTTEWFLPDQKDRDRAMELYSDPSFPSDHQRMNRFIRDVTFDCSNRDVATIWASQGVPVYLYQFSFDFTGFVQNKIGDAHAFELPFVWDNWDKIFGTFSIQGSRKSYQHMADIMSCTWASFINCQAPKCDENPPNCKSALKDVPAWPQYDSDNRYYISLSAHSQIESVQSATPIYQSDEFPGDDRCDFFETANLDWQPIRESASAMWLNSSRVYMSSQPVMV